MYQTNDYLLEDIQKLRRKMIDSAEVHGLTSEITVQYSQELDQLIIQYQRMNQRKPNHPVPFKWVMGQRVLKWPKSLLVALNMIH